MIILNRTEAKQELLTLMQTETLTERCKVAVCMGMIALETLAHVTAEVDNGIAMIREMEGKT